MNSAKNNTDYKPPEYFYVTTWHYFDRARDKKIRRALFRMNVGPYQENDDAGTVHYDHARDAAIRFLQNAASFLVGSPYEHHTPAEIRSSNLGKQWAYVAAALELEKETQLSGESSYDIAYVRPVLADVLLEARAAAQEHGFGTPLSERARLPRGRRQFMEAKR